MVSQYVPRRMSVADNFVTCSGVRWLQSLVGDRFGEEQENRTWYYQVFNKMHGYGEYLGNRLRYYAHRDINTKSQAVGGGQLST